jgi:hypothetical protein
LAYSDLPIELADQVKAQVHDRGGELEVRFMRRAKVLQHLRRIGECLQHDVAITSGIRGFLLLHRIRFLKWLIVCLRGNRPIHSDTVSEVSQQMQQKRGLEEDYFRNQHKEGRGPEYIKPSPRRVFFSTAALDAWMRTWKVVTR